MRNVLLSLVACLVLMSTTSAQTSYFASHSYSIKKKEGNNIVTFDDIFRLTLKERTIEVALPKTPKLVLYYVMKDEHGAFHFQNTQTGAYIVLEADGIYINVYMDFNDFLIFSRVREIEN